MSGANVHTKYAKMIRGLQREDGISAHDLAEISGMQYLTVLRILTVWRKLKLVHISDWEPDRHGRYKTRLFSFGHGKDVPRPKLPKESMKQRFAQWEARRDMARLLGVMR